MFKDGLQYLFHSTTYVVRIFRWNLKGYFCFKVSRKSNVNSAAHTTDEKKKAVLPKLDCIFCALILTINYYSIQS